MLPQRYLLHFLLLFEWYDASVSGAAVFAFPVYLLVSLAPLL